MSLLQNLLLSTNFNYPSVNNVLHGLQKRKKDKKGYTVLRNIEKCIEDFQYNLQFAFPKPKPSWFLLY